MLSKEEISEINENSKFLFEKINKKDFRDVKNRLIKLQFFFYENYKNFSYYKNLIWEIGWWRDEIEATQKNKNKYEKEAEDLITELNKLVLIIIAKIMLLKDEEKDKLLEDANFKFDPIFIQKDVKKGGFASFSEIELERTYYEEIYSKLIDTTKSEFPKLKERLEEYEKWSRKKNEELAKEWGFKK